MTRETPTTGRRYTAAQMQDMLAQLDDSVPFYLPTLLQQAAATERVIERLRELFNDITNHQLGDWLMERLKRIESEEAR